MKLIRNRKTYPINLEYAKYFANITTDHEDVQLETMLTGCIHACEMFADICIASTTVTEFKKIYAEKGNKVSGLANTKRLQLQFSPIKKLESLSTITKEGKTELIAANNYTFNKNLGKFFFENDILSYPISILDPAEYYEIEYTSGYTEDDIPEDIQQAVLSLFSITYETRGLEVYGKFDPLPSTVTRLLMPYKLESMNRVN